MSGSNCVTWASKKWGGSINEKFIGKGLEDGKGNNCRNPDA